MAYALTALASLLAGWVAGWAHSICFTRANEEALLEEAVKLDLEIMALKEALARHESQAPAPAA
jgi:hypothetical protein